MGSKRGCAVVEQAEVSTDLGDAKRTFEVFPKLFAVNGKKRYAEYRDIAVARLPDDVRGVPGAFYF